jgi:hypothetical protein
MFGIARSAVFINWVLVMGEVIMGYGLWIRDCFFLSFWTCSHWLGLWGVPF